ncbi:hypothetical protein DENSPDRAFT_841460 [Dentipellis sp. KUC8613]|nr:hypothetical protein DENSPDRAFT_841460 [Dentipellis sp. KUC8613]
MLDSAPHRRPSGRSPRLRDSGTRRPHRARTSAPISDIRVACGPASNRMYSTASKSKN